MKRKSIKMCLEDILGVPYDERHDIVERAVVEREPRNPCAFCDSLVAECDYYEGCPTPPRCKRGYDKKGEGAA